MQSSRLHETAVETMSEMSFGLLEGQPPRFLTRSKPCEPSARPGQSSTAGSVFFPRSPIVAQRSSHTYSLMPQCSFLTRAPSVFDHTLFGCTSSVGEINYNLATHIQNFKPRCYRRVPPRPTA